MRAVGVHEDVLVVTSQCWAASGTALRAGSEGFLVDCPILPGELEALPALLEQSGFPVSGLLATHVDWDHVLGRLAFPGAALGVSETSAARLRGEPGAAQRELREFDEQWYVARSAPLTLGDIQALPVPGHLELGGNELELHPADGHTPDGMAIWAPWAGVLIAGDYLSPVEIPWLSEGGSLDGYLATLARLRPLAEAAETVVPGHGGPIPAVKALEILEEDVAYLEGLRANGADAPLPEGRRTAEQRKIHAENAGRLRS
jgi:glyoxylase-like metal-dependent hydrolase (beta-lactamase superfamily II)